MGVLLYFLAGLLPNPDGPWSPTVSNCHVWVAAVLLEAVIAAVLKLQQRFIEVPTDLLDTLFALALARIVVLLVMTAVLVRRQFASRPTVSASSTPEERQGLLGNGQGQPDHYGATHAHGHAQAAKPPTGRPRDAQSSGWLDYIAGFRILFPYLW